MDYGIIFIIIIVIIILIAIVLLIYANRSNVTNILATFPSYRIQYVDNLLTTNNYLSLRNVSLFSPSQNGGIIPREEIGFYTPFVYSGASNTDPLGIWKIENLQQDNKIPITSGEEVYIVNFVYYSQTSNQTGYLAFQGGAGATNKVPVVPTADIKSAAKFIYTIVGVNLFTLSTTGGFPMIIDKTNNRFVEVFNKNVKPSVFKLDFQLQPSK